MENWLKGLGFSRGNPFRTVEAEQERTILPEFFVEIEEYERINGGETLLIFAPRGSGKSALRVMLATQSAPTSPKSSTLAIECTDFDVLIRLYRSGKPLRIEDHVAWFLEMGLNELLMTMGDPVRVGQISQPRASLLRLDDKLHFAGLIQEFGGGILNVVGLYRTFSELDPAFEAVFWNDGNKDTNRGEVLSDLEMLKLLEEAVSEQNLGNLIQQTVLFENPLAKLIGELIDLIPMGTLVSPTTTKKVSLFVEIALRAGFSKVQFLLDGIDEVVETAGDAAAQADILIPLVSHLPILELSNVAFKFFIPKETRDELVKRSTFRNDRLMDQMITVHWDRDRLEYLLNERLSVFSDDRIPDISLLFENSKWGVEVSEEMITFAQGSPRRLIRAGRELFSAHLIQKGPEGMLDMSDWEQAKRVLAQVKIENELEMEFKVDSPTMSRPKVTGSDFELSEIEVPCLSLGPVSAFLGDKEISLTPLEFKFLKCLIDMGGEGQKEDLIDAVYESDSDLFANQALDSLVRRLRKKLGDMANNPTYLVTIRGQGYRLKNVVLQ